VPNYQRLKKPIVNIGILLLLIIVLPPLIFTTYEVGNYYQNEELIDSIYTSQLESVIFSVNQYSDDLVSGWGSKIERELSNKPTSEEEIITGFIRNNISVDMIFFIDKLQITRIFHSQQFNGDKDESNKVFEKIIETNLSQIQILEQYIEAGYRKIQPIDINVPDKSLFLFAIKSDTQIRIIGIVVKTLDFIKESLGPKIQAVAQDIFYLSVFESVTDIEVYSNELYESEDKNIKYKEQLWLLPDYLLGIQLKGETIEDIVQQRMKSSIWLIVIMDIILILAAYFVYKGVRQQMKLAKLKSEFVSNVSHEIRTPLAIINMYSETLSLGRIKDEEKKREYYKVINTETNRLTGIVNKILNFSKIDDGKRDYNFSESDLNILIEQIINTYQHHFKRKEVKCNFSPQKYLPMINMDKDAITDAAINLIENAIKYGGDKKQIDIRVGSDYKYVYVEVQDYGVGIEEKYQKMVFDKFFRVTKGNIAHQAKGSGIGLSIVKNIMTAHNGTVTLVSKPGEGSKFRLNFPRIKL